MGNYWIKFKFWAKISLFGLLTLYALVFFIKNGEQQAHVWYWVNREVTAPTLLLVFFSFAVGAVVALLVRTMVTTIRQFREMRQQNRTDRLEREVAEMKSKAAMLNTKQTPPSDD